ncbi:MAG: hypothetical protein ACRENE_13445 [Polyangiaceae bacterium]
MTPVTPTTPRIRTPWLQQITVVLAWGVLLGMAAYVLAPTLGDRTTIGGHDWDQMESHRYLVTKTILRFHQFPFWNPYACGGHATWGGFESGTIVVSPWLPFYLLFSLPLALRVEIFGSALVSMIGAWLLAGRFTRSAAVRALVVVVFAVNGRWTLQLAAGHTWHLVYGLTPWALYFYDRAAGASPLHGAPRWRDTVYLGVTIAMMVYTGGIYPLPQTALLVAVYGVALSIVTRSLRPLGVGLVGGAIAVGLAAPKLLPIVEVLSRFPRLIDSTEFMDFMGFVQILVAPDQDMGTPASHVSQWGWHEWGMYIGWAAVVLVFIGTILGRGVRESPLKWAGLVALVLGLGAFDPHSPWAELHKLPVFKSQHVPSRWLYPSLLMLATVTASVFERGLRRAGRARAWLEVAMLPAVAWIAYDIASVARLAMTHTFANHMPKVAESTGPFHTEITLPRELEYASDYAPPSLPAEMANIGTIACGTFPGLNVYVRDADGRVSGLGARGRSDPLYRGEAFVPEGLGTAEIVSFSPNAITVRVTGSQAGDHVVVNQNWDGGWRADGEPALNWSDTIATQLHAADSTITFRYRPRSWYLALVWCAATLGAIAYAYRVRRRMRRATSRA